MSFPATLIANSGIDGISSMAVLRGNVAVICGEEERIRKIKSYNLQSGMQLNSITLDLSVGLAEVKFGENLLLAVSNM